MTARLSNLAVSTMSLNQILRIQRSMSLEAFEKAIEELTASTDIVLPNTIKIFSFAGEAALIQLIITWARRNPLGTIRLYAGKNKAECTAVVANFSREVHAVASICTGRQIGFYPDDGQNVRLSILDKVKEVFAAEAQRMLPNRSGQVVVAMPYRLHELEWPTSFYSIGMIR